MAATRRTVRLADLLGSGERAVDPSLEELERLRAGDPSACPDLDPADRRELLADAALFDRLVEHARLTSEERTAYEQSDRAVRERLGLPAAQRRRLRWTPVVGGLIAASLLTVALLLPGGREPGFVDVAWIPLAPPPTVRGESQQLWQALEIDWAAEDWDAAAGRIDAATSDPALTYYRALALYRDGRLREAGRALEPLVEREGEAPSAMTLWLLAAIQEHRDGPEAACATLARIEALEGSAAERAADLIRAHCR